MARYNAGGTKNTHARTEEQIAVRLARHEWAWVVSTVADEVEALERNVRESGGDAQILRSAQRLGTILARICHQLDLVTTEERR